MRGLVRAALPIAMAVAATTAVAIDVATQPATVATVPATVATVPASVTPFCDVDFCAIPDAKGTGEWVVYVTGHDHVAMFHQAYPTDAPRRDAS